MQFKIFNLGIIQIVYLFEYYLLFSKLHDIYLEYNTDIVWRLLWLSFLTINYVRKKLESYIICELSTFKIAK